MGASAYVVGGFAAPDGATTDSSSATTCAPTAGRASRRSRRPSTTPPRRPIAARVRRRRLYERARRRDRGAWRYDPARDRWTRLADAPTARGALVAGVVGDRLYVAGGARGGKALKTLEIYDFARRRWSTGPPMRVAREHLAGAVLGGAFYALAGRTAGRGNFKVVERYVPARRRWERVPSMRKPRGGIAAATVNGRIVVVGGEEAAGTIGEVESFEPLRGRWRFEPRLPTPRHGLGAVAFGGRIFVLEGGPQPGLFYSDAAEALRVARPSTGFGDSSARAGGDHVRVSVHPSADEPPGAAPPVGTRTRSTRRSSATGMAGVDRRAPLRTVRARRRPLSARPEADLAATQSAAAHKRVPHPAALRAARGWPSLRCPVDLRRRARTCSPRGPPTDARAKSRGGWATGPRGRDVARDGRGGGAGGAAPSTCGCGCGSCWSRSSGLHSAYIAYAGVVLVWLAAFCWGC